MLAVSDLLMGVMIGAYEPLLRYSRDNDCFSRMFKLGTDLFKYDRHFEGKPVGGAVKKAFFTVTVLSDLQNAMKTVGICYA